MRRLASGRPAGRAGTGRGSRPWTMAHAALRKSATTMAPFDHEIAMRSENLPGFGSRDPADRFLVATALVHGLTLATADRAMHEFEAVPVVG